MGTKVIATVMRRITSRVFEFWGLPYIDPGEPKEERLDFAYFDYGQRNWLYDSTPPQGPRPAPSHETPREEG